MTITMTYSEICNELAHPTSPYPIDGVLSDHNGIQCANCFMHDTQPAMPQDVCAPIIDGITWDTQEDDYLVCDTCGKIIINGAR